MKNVLISDDYIPLGVCEFCLQLSKGLKHCQQRWNFPEKCCLEIYKIFKE